MSKKATKNVIVRNIEIREHAELVFQTMELYDPADDDSTRRFYEHIARMAADKCGMQVQAASLRSPMGRAEALEFEDTIVPFGIHEGRKVGSVPPSYWLAINEGAFSIELRRYMASMRFFERQDTRGS